MRVYARLGSTNARAAALLEAGGLRLPAAVVAARQTAGRGRGANRWWSDAGTLTATFVFPQAGARPGMAGETARPPQELPLRAGLAVRAVAARYVAPDRLRVKWPNDLLADGRKLAGVLCARTRGAELVGIGLNVSTDFAAAPPEVRRRAVSLAELMRGEPGAVGGPPSRAEVFVALAHALREAWDLADWWEELNRVHALTGQRVAVNAGGAVVRGVCAGIDREGRLLVDEGGQRHAIASGEVLGTG